MPSTLVHLGIGATVAAALLGREFDARALGVVLLAVAFPDLDTFLGIWVQGGHRALLHTVLLPAALGVGLLADARYRGRFVRRYGARGLRVAGVAVTAMAVAGIAPDLVTNGVNAFYPVYDQFIQITGELKLSNQRGVVQTFVEFESPEPAAGTSVGTTETTHYSTGVDPEAGAEPENVERVFPVVTSGMELLLVGVGVLTAGARLYEE
jgi:hypothetical protein